MTTKLHFDTPQQVFEHCEKEGIMTRRHVNGLGEVEYWVDVYHNKPHEPMVCFYSDRNIVGWANLYFNDPYRDSYWDQEDTYEDPDDEDNDTDVLIIGG